MSNVDATRHVRRHAHQRGRGAGSIALRLLAAMATLLSFAALQQTVGSPAPAAAASTVVNLRLVDATTGAAIPSPAFHYLVNLDNTGETGQRSPSDGCSPSSAGYADPPGDNAGDSCRWTSMGINSSSPVVTQGDQSDFPNGLSLEPGRYLISVLADGYKLDGVHVTVPVSGTVDVPLQPFDLPDSTIQAAVFEDTAPTNGAPDVPAERGLAGFRAILADNLGQVTTDVYGNPLCTTYVPGTTDVLVPGGNCLSKCYDANDAVVAPLPDGVHCPDGTQGKVVIPHMGTNRYALSVNPPDGQGWIQTTTLEGNHDWDTWVMEGSTGLDTEFVQAGEPFPAVIFGYVQERNTLPATATGSISGVVDAVKWYYPPKGGQTLPGEIFGGLQGGRIDKPIAKPWLALSDLSAGDSVVWVGQGGTDGTFTIPHVPDGTYQLTWWDEPQNYILNLQQVSVVGGQPVDMGILPLNGWWTSYEGYVFNDLNRNGVKDPGENGIPNFTVVLRKRDNSLMDRGGRVVSTDLTGKFVIENAYPLTQWFVMEAYDDRFYTTGVTYQADNAAPTTVLADREPAGNPNGRFVGTGVDVNTLPVIGLGGRIDWGVHVYDPTGATGGVDPRNGGIVGTVSYDTTRNELDPRYAAVEDWQPGVPDMTVNLYSTVDCTTTCDDTGRYELDTDGSYKKGPLLNTTVTETWEQPRDCTALDVDGNPLVTGVDQNVLPTQAGTKCLEGPLMGVQFDEAWASVDGNYGFSDGCLGTGGMDPDTGACVDGADPQVLPGGYDYLVEVVSPQDTRGRDLYQFTREEDINIGNGDSVVPQIPPPACAGPLHTVDVAGIAPDGPDATDNPTFAELGGSPYEGMAKPLCSTKLVPLNNGKSVAPTFNVFTDVPLPTRFWGLIVDDLNFSSDPRSLLFGEKAGIPFAPVGIYDYTNRLVYTAESDFNGLFDVLLPSTNRINCPTPSGVCPNLYRFVGNDPGIPGRLNLNYQPQFRTIAAEFEAIPGVNIIADVAPTQVGVNVQLPGGQINQVQCSQAATTPQLMQLTRVHGNATGGGAAASRTTTINGVGFGPAGGGALLMDGAPIATTSWSDTAITATIPASVGPHQLTVRNAAGMTSTNGITFHVLGNGYNPTVREVGPGKAFAPANTLPNAADHAIQRAIDASAPGDLVVVYPQHPQLVDTNPRGNPRGAYYENLIINKRIKLQGTGPGGIRPNGTEVPGAIIDGGAYGGDSPVATDWLTKITTPAYATWVGNQTLNDGAVITLFAPATNTFPLSPSAIQQTRIDGFDLRGGDQQGFPTNLNVIGGLPTGLPANVVTQGGAVFANAYVRALQLTNNVVENNGGAYGTIRIGTPNIGSSNNENVRIANNRIVHNAGTNLAGAIGIFGGANGYDVAANDICGNFSAEYGGGVSVYGRSPGGRITGNRITFNQSYDEGGGVMVAGELPANPTQASPGVGTVEISANLIQANLGNDDGGGLRFLQAGTDPMNVVNNLIVNNVSTHEGGGVSINDTTNVRVVNNTIMKNVTTATAVTSDGTPAPAGLSSSQTSAVLGGGFANPLLFNNVFWDNRAGTRAGTTVSGIGLAGDANPINNWDLGVADALAGQQLTPTNSIIQQSTAAHPYVASATNSTADPAVQAATDVGVSFQVWRNNPAFVGALLVAVDAPAAGLGNYHLTAGSPAVNLGAVSRGGVNAPAVDYDGQGRPAGGGFDAGADEVAGTATSPVDLGVTVTDNQTSVVAETNVAYVVTVTKNATTAAVAGVRVVDTPPASLGNLAWSCTASGAGSSCAASTGSGPIDTTVTLGASAASTATFVLVGRLAAGSIGTLADTATVTAPVTATETAPGNNTSTDTDAIVTAVSLLAPALPVLDTFTGSGNLSTDWNQVGTAIQRNANQAFCGGGFLGLGCLLGGSAYRTPVLGARQAASVAFANTPVAGTPPPSVVLKASGGTANAPLNFVRVGYASGTVTVATTATLGLSYVARGTIAATFATGDTLAAVADSGGNVFVFKNGTLLGVVAIPVLGANAWTSGTTPLAIGTGRIGMQMPRTQRFDNFAGGSIA